MNDIALDDGVAPPPPPTRPAEIAFLGEDKAFRDLVFKGAALEIVTFGFYRFWLATAMRRYLWTNTIVDGDAFDYRGTARELLLGFLFALAILAPVYFVSFVLGVEAEREASFSSLFGVVFFTAFFQFAIYRARRYRLNRTIWRGLRFDMDGSGVKYALLAMGWMLATGLTLGLALPWMQAALERYKMRHTHYGVLPGDFVGTGGQFFREAGVLWLAASGTFAMYMGGILLATEGKQPGFALLTLVSLPAAVFVYAAFKAAQWKWWIEGLRLGEARATSSLAKSSLFGNYWTYTGLVIVIFVGLSLLVFTFAGAIPKGARPSPAVIAAIIFLYAGMLVALMTLWRIYFVQRVWKIVVNSLTLHNAETTRDVLLRPGVEVSSALGEGFADSLDVAGF